MTKESPSLTKTARPTIWVTEIVGNRTLHREIARIN